MEKSLSLIVVDDEKPLLDMLEESLGSYGHVCRTYTNGNDALAAIAAAPPDVVITDIKMPGMQGLELTKEIKRIQPGIIVILMTGFVEDFSYDQAVAAGAADFIKKPFTVQELLMRIRHVIMQEKLRTISITDELTGLLNRRGFFAMAEQQMKLVNRMKGKVGLLFADIDNFKSINDTWGHQEGDNALISMSEILHRTFRESDIIARMSGDEFAVLLIDAPSKNLAQVTARLRQNLEDFNRSSGARYALSLSTGIVEYDHEEPRTIDDMLKEADALMYREKTAKKAGGEGQRPAS